MTKPPFRYWRLQHRLKVAMREGWPQEEILAIIWQQVQLRRRELVAEVQEERQAHPENDAALGQAHL